MDEFISGLCASLGTDAFWGCFLSIIPILAISVLFGLGKMLIDYIIYSISLPDRKSVDDREDYDYDDYEDIYDDLDDADYVDNIEDYEADELPDYDDDGNSTHYNYGWREDDPDYKYWHG